MHLRFAACLFPLVLAGATCAAEFDAAAAANAIGLKLYRQLAPASPQENLVLSPYSIESALALTYTGADGDTRQEMARVLQLPAEDGTVQRGFSALREALARTAEQSKELAERNRAFGGKTDPIQWAAANRLFGQEGYAFRAPFLALMKEGFSAPFEVLDFQRDAERARGVINGWVEEQTRRKIKDLIPHGGVDGDTRLVLVNALYLKAPWEKPFEKTATRPRAFAFPDGTSREIPTMHRTGALGHATEAGLTLVSLDYLGGELQFLVILPDTGTSVDEAAAKLTPAHFTRWAKLGEGRRPSVSLYLPKFRVEGRTVPLGDALRGLGMKRAFDEPAGSADFSRMAPRTPADYLAISKVFHQTFVALDEEGTEAAAATAVGMVALAAMIDPPRPIEVRVDRPFLFAIQHRPSGACLFLGRIAHPR